VEAAVEQYGLALQYASNELKEDFAICDAAVAQNAKARKYCCAAWQEANPVPGTSMDSDEVRGAAAKAKKQAEAEAEAKKVEKTLPPRRQLAPEEEAKLKAMNDEYEAERAARRKAAEEAAAKAAKETKAEEAARRKKQQAAEKQAQGKREAAEKEHAQMEKRRKKEEQEREAAIAAKEQKTEQQLAAKKQKEKEKVEQLAANDAAFNKKLETMKAERAKLEEEKARNDFKKSEEEKAKAAQKSQEHKKTVAAIRGKDDKSKAEISSKKAVQEAAKLKEFEERQAVAAALEQSKAREKEVAAEATATKTAALKEKLMAEAMKGFVARDSFDEEDLERSVDAKVRMQMRKHAAADSSIPFGLLVTGTSIALGGSDNEAATGASLKDAEGRGKSKVSHQFKWRLDADGKLEHEATRKVLAYVKSSSGQGRKQTTTASLQLVTNTLANDDSQVWTLNAKTGALSCKAASGLVLTAKGEGDEVLLSKPAKKSGSEQHWAFRS
jgi:hypothetical protein